MSQYSLHELVMPQSPSRPVFDSIGRGSDSFIECLAVFSSRSLSCSSSCSTFDSAATLFVSFLSELPLVACDDRVSEALINFVPDTKMSVFE